MNKSIKETNHLSDTEPRWFAVKTKYKAEKCVEKQLTKKKIVAYLPILTKIRVYTRKKRTIHYPLISSHIFVMITKNQYVTVLETQYVHGFLKHGPNLLSIPKEEIELMKRVVGSDLDVEVCKDQLEVGDKVEIIGGSLTGLNGYLARRENKNKFVVHLKTMNVQIEIVIDPKFLVAYKHSLKN